eukprot:5100357-Prymnesium_polylepis.1
MAREWRGWHGPPEPRGMCVNGLRGRGRMCVNGLRGRGTRTWHACETRERRERGHTQRSSDRAGAGTRHGPRVVCGAPPSTARA